MAVLACQLGPAASAQEPAELIAPSSYTEQSSPSGAAEELGLLRVVPESVTSTYGDRYPEYRVHLEGDLDQVDDDDESMILSHARSTLVGPEPTRRRAPTR